MWFLYFVFELVRVKNIATLIRFKIIKKNNLKKDFFAF